MAVRIKYSGIDTDLITIQSDLKLGIERAVEGSGEVNYILSTYTALFQCQKILQKMPRESFDRGQTSAELG